ncbi:hypothetical protein IPJ72_06465 [Candidatus Peregrinibacteria bacterium]|nr:MAG: hypothetical protein IPJ72_06465 [Candidatus Peregrinibacteria bacterium]
MTTLSLRKILTVLIATALLTGVLSLNTFAAVECDQDGDGYISIPARVMQAVGVQEYDENGNYPADQWQVFFSISSCR